MGGQLQGDSRCGGYARNLCPIYNIVEVRDALSCNVSACILSNQKPSNNYDAATPTGHKILNRQSLCI